MRLFEYAVVWMGFVDMDDATEPFAKLVSLLLRTQCADLWDGGVTTYFVFYFFFPFVLSRTSTQCLFTPLFSNAFTTASFCGP